MNSGVRIVLQFAIGMVLLLAGAGKWRHPLRFAQGVADYEILPPGLAYWVGLLLMPLEIWLAVAHLTGWLLRFAAPTALATFMAFALAVGINLGRGRALPCFCFGGKGSDEISGATLARLLLLISGEGLLLLRWKTLGAYQLINQQITSLAELGFVVFWAVVLLLAVMWALSIADFIALFRRCPNCGQSDTKGNLVFAPVATTGSVDK